MVAFGHLEESDLVIFQSPTAEEQCLLFDVGFPVQRPLNQIVRVSERETILVVVVGVKRRIRDEWARAPLEIFEP